MKIRMIGALVLMSGFLGAGEALAQERDWHVSANVALTSDCVFCGISQTRANHAGFYDPNAVDDRFLFSIKRAL